MDKVALDRCPIDAVFGCIVRISRSLRGALQIKRVIVLHVAAADPETKKPPRLERRGEAEAS